MRPGTASQRINNPVSDIHSDNESSYGNQTPGESASSVTWNNTAALIAGSNRSLMQSLIPNLRINSYEEPRSSTRGHRWDLIKLTTKQISTFLD